MAAFEFRLRRAAQPLTDAWQRMPVTARQATQLGISFRPLQAAKFGLDPDDSLRALLAYPFQLVRLGAYWNRMEPEPGAFDTAELDRHIEAAEQAGKRIILCVGAVKTFGYPEFFVPGHHLPQPLPEGKRIGPIAFAALLSAAADFITRLVARYRTHQSIVAWQLEHEAVDPLGVEHSWRLDAAFVAQEAQALRQADPTRPVMLNGFLPAAAPVRLSQWWATRDQGDSLAVAQRLGDWVGVDYYPRFALAALGKRTLYLDGSQSAWQRNKRKALLAWAAAQGKHLLIAEGQAEPWEAVTTPPNPRQLAMASCLPEHLISNYNDCAGAGLYAYLFWGAEYWLAREKSGDASYLKAFQRVLDQAER
jgi:beta-galactosidase GanA